MYKVVRRFKEIEHDGHIYEVDDNYPEEGYKTSKQRIVELSTTKNKCKQIFIEKVEKTPDEKE